MAGVTEAGQTESGQPPCSASRAPEQGRGQTRMETMTMEKMRTSDLALSSYLVMEGYSPERMELVDNRTVFWVFEDGETLKGLVEEYHQGDAAVEPQEFLRITRDVRQELYQFLRDKGLPPRAPAEPR